MKLDAIRTALNGPNSGQPRWTTEEAIMSMPYSEAEEWEKMLEYQYFAGGQHFNGPPGMWDKLVERIEAEGRAVNLPRFVKGRQG